MRFQIIATFLTIIIFSVGISPAFALYSVPEIKIDKKQPIQCIAKPIEHMNGKKTLLTGNFRGSISAYYSITSDGGTQLWKSKAGVMYGSAAFKNIQVPDDSKNLNFCVGRAFSEPARGSATYDISYQ